MKWPRIFRESVDTTTTLDMQIAAFEAEMMGSIFTPSLIDTIWAAERSIQLNAQQIATMPLRFQGNAPNSREPAWLSSPDPAFFPNGIGESLFAAVDDYYRFGDTYLYVTSDYSDGYPSAWTVLDSKRVGIEFRNGHRNYRIDEQPLVDANVVQISRNPRSGKLKGTSALRAYASIVSASAAGTFAAETSLTTLPPAILRASRKLTKEQAQALQAQYRESAAARLPGEPIVLSPELELLATNLGFSPEDLLLVAGQEFNARTLASAFGVPPFLLNLPLTGGLTYQNPAMMGEYWWRTELHATCGRFARAMTARLLPAGSSVYFDPAHLTQPLTDQTNVDESPAVKASPADSQPIPTSLRPALEVMTG